MPVDAHGSRGEVARGRGGRGSLWYRPGWRGRLQLIDGDDIVVIR